MSISGASVSVELYLGEFRVTFSVINLMRWCLYRFKAFHFSDSLVQKLSCLRFQTDETQVKHFDNDLQSFKLILKPWLSQTGLWLINISLKLDHLSEANQRGKVIEY